MLFRSIREDGPPQHFAKAGTPTMGGFLILLAIIISTLLWADLTNGFVWAVLLITVGFGAIGFVDDYRKLVLHDRRGLSMRAKYFWQSLAALGAAVAIPLGLWLEPRRRIAESVIRVTGVTQTIPSIALLAFMIPLLGVGFTPAVVALWIYSLFPILRNTYTGIREVERLMQVPLADMVIERLAIQRC